MLKNRPVIQALLNFILISPLKFIDYPVLRAWTK